jgi:peptide/nickel transport system permease protein
LAAHFTLPVATLSLAYIAMWNRYLRASLHAILAQDYILMAHSKGLSWWKVMVRHAMPNALNPLISQVAVDFGSIFTGAVVTETIFGWAGLGRLFFDSLASRDYPILLSTLLLGAVSFMLFNLVADVLYAVVDPRIRYS